MRVLLKILGVLFLLVCLLIAVVVFLPDQQYQTITQKVVKKLIDREVSIEELTTVRSLNPSIEIKNISIANSSWAKSPEMVKADNLYLSVDLAELFTGKLHINELSANNINIDLVKNEQGEANWHFKQQKTNRDNKFDIQNLTRLVLAKFNLNNAQVDYRDEKEKLQYRLELPSMQLAQTAQRNIQRINAGGLFNDLPFSINGEAGLIDSLVKSKSLPFKLETVLNESKINFKGEILDQSNGMHFTTKVVAQTNSLADLSIFSANELPSIGPITISADITGNLKSIVEQGIDIDNLDIHIDDPSITLDINGSLSGLAARNEGDVNIDLDVSDLTKLFKLAGLDKNLPGTLTLQASAKGSGENFGLEISKAILDSDFLQAELSGNIKNLLNGSGVAADIKAQAPNLDIVTQLFNRKMPPEWGPITASAKLVGNEGQYSLQDIQAEMSGLSKVNASGSIEKLIGFDGMQLDVEATLATLGEISAFTKSPLPDIGPVNATGKITWQDGKLTLLDAKAKYSGQYGNADVTGSIGDLVKFDIVRLKADASVPNLAVAEVFSGVKMPNVGQIKATADLVSPTALDLSAKNINASYDHNGVTIKAVGSIDSMIKKRAELNLDVQADVNSLASLNTILKADLPKIGPIAAQAMVIGATKNIQVNAIQANVKDSVLTGVIQGDLGQVIGFKGIDLRTDLMTPSMQKLLSRFKIKTDVKKPASLTSHFEYLDGVLHLDAAELDVGGNKIIGDLSMLNYFDKSQRQKLVGEINVLNFDLLDVTGKKLGQEKQVEESKADKLLSNEPLPFDFIRKNDFELKIKIGRLRAKVFDFANAAVTVKSHNGVFQFGPFEGKVGGGDALFQLDVNTKTTPALSSFNARIEGFDMAKAGAFRDSDMIQSSGDAFVNLVVNGSGDSLASILSNANGGGALYFEDLLLKKGTLGLFSSDVMRQTLDAINPFKKKEKDTQINCSAVAFRINDGLLTTPYGVAAEAKDFSVTGKGQVNFKNEAINLEFNTKPKKGLGIGFGKLTGLVQVKGTIGTPQVTLDPKGIFELGATVGAAIATGGLSLLAQGQLEKMQAKSELCAKALGPTG